MFALHTMHFTKIKTFLDKSSHVARNVNVGQQKILFTYMPQLLWSKC